MALQRFYLNVAEAMNLECAQQISQAPCWKIPPGHRGNKQPLLQESIDWVWQNRYIGVI